MAAVYLPDSWLWSRLDFLSPGLVLEKALYVEPSSPAPAFPGTPRVS